MGREYASGHTSPKAMAGILLAVGAGTVLGLSALSGGGSMLRSSAQRDLLSISNRIEQVKSFREQGLNESADLVASYVQDNLSVALRPDYELTDKQKAQYTNLRDSLTQAMQTTPTNQTFDAYDSKGRPKSTASVK